MEPDRILIVDDEESIRFTLSAFLAATGAEVETAATFDAALALVAEQTFDLIFADILLDQRTGIDLLREVRQQGVTAPLVLITGVPEFDTATAALRLGAFDYIAKPVTRETLLRVAGQALQVRRNECEREARRRSLESLFDSVHDGILTVDRELRIKTRNRAARQSCLLALSDAAAGMEEAGCRQLCLDLLQQALERGETAEERHVRCPAQAGERIFSLRASPLRQEDGSLDGAVLVIHPESPVEAVASPPGPYFGRLVGKSLRMQEIYSLIDVLADVDTTVLVTGESGTGKELIAEALHYGGRRAGGPLVKVNCAAIPEPLFESELFGHVRGAFTGAVADKAGRFQKAHGGTIFLDEIADLPAPLQVRLLRVLQEKTIERVGDSVPIKVDVRIVTATNQDLMQRVRQGQFREDLFYRLKVVNIDLPPLRKRKEDIPALLEHFRLRFNQRHRLNIQRFPEEVLLTFLRYDWPGNVRELEHAIEHAAVMSKGETVALDSLPPELRPLTGGNRYIRRDEAGQVESLRAALEKAGGNKAKAARLLGVSRQTLYRKLSEHGFEVEDEVGMVRDDASLPL